MASSQRKNPVWVHDVLRVTCPLDSAHQVDGGAAVVAGNFLRELGLLFQPVQRTVKLFYQHDCRKLINVL